MKLVNAVTSGLIWNISRIGVTFHKKVINGSVMEFFLLITLTVVQRRQPRLSWPSAPAKEGTRYSLNLVVSGHKQLWSPPAANRLPMWLRNYSSIGHSFNCSKWHCLRPSDAWGGCGWVGRWWWWRRRRGAGSAVVSLWAPGNIHVKNTRDQWVTLYKQ